MSFVSLLLTFPQSSTGFSAIRQSVVDNIDDGSASPRRKVPRLDTDSDSASASRYTSTQDTAGPIKLKIVGDFVEKRVDVEAQLSFLRRCISTILTRESPPVLPATYESIYSACRFVVSVSKAGHRLSEILKTELSQCIKRTARALSESQETGITWIAFAAGCFHWFQDKIALLQSLLTYLDQLGIAEGHFPSLHIKESAYNLFQEGIFENPIIADQIRSGLDEWISWERQYRLDHSERPFVKAFIKHLILHKQYSWVEEYYISTSHQFYVRESAKLAETAKDDAPGFFRWAKLRIEEEDSRAKEMLPVGSWTAVREVIEKSLWNDRVEWLSNMAIGTFMAGDIAALSSMYALFSRVDGKKVLCAAFRKHIQTSVEEIVKDQENDETMVQRLLDLKANADQTIHSAFLDEKHTLPMKNNSAASTSVVEKVVNQDFVYALGDAFSTGFKARRNKPAEMIAKYLDRAMRKGQGSSSDSAFEAMLDSVLALYRYTDDKDVFRTFYHRSLAKRLLLEKSASDDFEAAMLKKLKQQYDPEFGMGEDMFKDLALSRDSMRDYHSKLPPSSEGHKLSVMVLQRSAWPFAVQKTTIDLPPNMKTELVAYTNYYKTKHSGHVLDWDHALGTATLKARFKAGSKELSVSLYQAVVLLLFNDSEEISFQEIKEQVRLEIGELRRTLQSLACGKKKVIRKIPPGKDVDNTDVFKFNAMFEDPRAKVHINSIQAKVSPEESRRTNVSIEGDRKLYLDAAIVRIMKARKELTYEQLKAATIDAVKSHFVPQIDIIKRRIDSLVDSDYLERSKEDKNKFLYVA